MDRMSFLSDLSLLDLLFNLGPRTVAYLESLKMSEDVK
jgi:hypothetical protein